ncbi:hypothetical protein, partial [Inquilinus limosus]|uniref:hypothetical protein n=1 Tax=Inquilinus limosus TaxID=171674 RepID=UPI003D2F18FC
MSKKTSATVFSTITSTASDFGTWVVGFGWPWFEQPASAMLVSTIAVAFEFRIDSPPLGKPESDRAGGQSLIRCQP